MQSPLARELFDLPSDLVWAMHCAEGPVPRASVAAARRFLELELRPWELDYAEWLALPGRVRELAATLLGVRAADVTVVSSTSAGLTTIAQTFPFEPGDEVVAPLGEFPANIWPWKALAARQVRFREVPLWEGQRAGQEAWSSSPPVAGLDPEARLLAALTARTRVLTVSWVRFQDGLVLDLARLARGCAARGVHLVVDGIQGAGTLPAALDGVAAFVTGVHKGMLAPQGTALLWTAPALRAQLSPLGSWLSVEDGADFRRPSTDHDRAWLEDGRKLEQGGYNGLAFSAVASSLELLTKTGPTAIAEHVRGLEQALLERLRRLPSFSAEAERSLHLLEQRRLGSILSLHHQGRGQTWLTALWQSGPARRVYTTVREGYLRIALHGWHGERDVEQLADFFAAAP